MNTLNPSSDPFGFGDPFNPITTSTDSEEQKTYKIHLRVRQRNARQTITTMSGLPNSYDLKNLSKKIKKKLCCNGAVVNDHSSTDEKCNKVLQFTGDQRKAIAKYLVKEGISKQKDISIHGY